MEAITDEAPNPVCARDSGAGANRFSMSAVEASFRKLMGDYSAVLAKASTLGPRRVPGQEGIAFFGAGFESAFLVRLMIQTHIRYRLRALAVAYAQLTPVVQSSAERAWLAQATADCTDIVEDLPRIQLRPLLLAFVLPVAAAISKLPGLPEWLVVLLVGLVGVVPTLLVLGFLSVRNSYRFKRELLLPGAREIDRLEAYEQMKRDEGNIYQAENEAFVAIGHGKRREREMDRLLIDLTILVLAQAIFLMAFVIPDDFWLMRVATALFVIGYLPRMMYQILPEGRVWRLPIVRWLVAPRSRFWR